MSMNMKKFILPALIALILLPFGTSCRQEQLSPESVIVTDSYEKNAFDLWLDANYVYPYNIEFKYRYENNETDLDYYTVPASYENSIVMAHLVKYLCIDSYDEVAGVTFTRTYFPKEFFLMGEWEYKNNGVYTLGTAEGGKKIILMGINYLPRYMTSASTLNYYYLKTIHHEFTHILNQTKDFPVSFSQVNGGSSDGYLADSWNASEYSSDYLQRGFITRYAQHSDTEDFAESMAMYVTNTAEWWQSQIEAAGADGAPGADRISTKISIVKSYMFDTFGIVLDDLRDAVLRRQAEVMAGNVDLHSLEIL